MSLPKLLFMFETSFWNHSVRDLHFQSFKYATCFVYMPSMQYMYNYEENTLCSHLHDLPSEALASLIWSVFHSCHCSCFQCDSALGALLPMTWRVWMGVTYKHVHEIRKASKLKSLINPTNCVYHYSYFGKPVAKLKYVTLSDTLH